MEFLIELAQIVGNKIVDASAKALETPEAQKAFAKRFRVLGQYFAIVILIISVVLPAYFFYSSFTADQLHINYFYFGIGLLLTTLFSHLFTAVKSFYLFRPATKLINTAESTTVEDEIRYEIGAAIILAVMSAIPVINLISLPLVIDRAIHIYEITSQNSKRQKIRELAENIAYISLIIFLMSTLIFSLFLIIAGDTRNL
jgi:hypothetical protein